MHNYSKSCTCLTSFDYIKFYDVCSHLIDEKLICSHCFWLLSKLNSRESKIKDGKTNNTHTVKGVIPWLVMVMVDPTGILFTFSNFTRLSKQTFWHISILKISVYLVCKLNFGLDSARNINERNINEWNMLYVRRKLHRAHTPCKMGNLHLIVVMKNVNPILPVFQECKFLR